MAVLDDAERALGLADQAHTAFEIEAVVVHLSAAVRALTAAGDTRRAAMTCARLGDVLANGLGNQTAGRAWFTRAERLLEDHDPCVEQGWVAIAAMGCDAGDPAELLRRADLALDRARRFGDLNLETKALADGGLARVQAGRLDEGFAMLDEAMALACGPADDVDTSGKSVCSFFTACFYAADYGRVGTWIELLRDRGLIGADPGAPVFLSNHCDAVQAALLVELGRWGEAEAVLTRAMQEFEATMRAPSWHPAIGLAELRVRQGRLADAEALLLGKDQAFEAMLPAARLHLARGDHALAAAAARRGLSALGTDHLRAAELLCVLVDAELGLGDLAAAQAACADLEHRTGRLGVPMLDARRALPCARAMVASGDRPAARALLERVLAGVDPVTAPWSSAVLHLELARVLLDGGDRPAAELAARSAGAMLSQLDVVVDVDHLRILTELGAERRVAARERTVTLRVDRQWCDVVAEGMTTRARSTKGLRYLAELVANPGAERHVFDLVDREEGVGEIDRRDLGDAGEAADSRARRAYRVRVQALQAEIEDALTIGRLERAERLQDELDAIVEQLAEAFGLGGHARRTASAVERARLNVTRALRAAVARVAEAAPDAGAMLDRRLRTGTYCAFEPDPADGFRWIVHLDLNETPPT